MVFGDDKSSSHCCFISNSIYVVPTSEFVQFKQAAQLLTKAVIIHNVLRANETGGKGKAAGEVNGGQGGNATATNPGERGNESGWENNATAISPGGGNQIFILLI